MARFDTPSIIASLEKRTSRDDGTSLEPGRHDQRPCIKTLSTLPQREGLESLTHLDYKGRRSYLTSEQEGHLQSGKAPHFHTLAEGQTWIAEQYKVTYTISGVSVLFERLRTKKKTGRTAHHQQNLADQEAFKKNL